MASPPKQNQDSTESKNHSDKDTFYETMPATWTVHGYPDVEDQAAPDDAEDYAKTTKTTAIITIVLSLLVAVALGVLFVRGIDTIKNAAPSQSDSTGSLEM